ncbi:MAG: MBL fold metallo-hydrolase [Caldilineaceae bacterium]|nr:MBL fold metallo-hydrolase [Caldilineaceae bacterium]
MRHTNNLQLVANQGWDERILVCRNAPLVDTFLVITQRYLVVVDTLINPTTAHALMTYAAPYLGHGRQLLVVNTHADYDHAWGNQIFSGPQAAYPAPIIATRLCAREFRQSSTQTLLQSMQAAEPAIFGEVQLTPPTLLFTDRFVIDGGDLTLELLATPGHTPDHLSVYLPEIATLLAADAAEYPFPLARTVAGLPGLRQSLAMQAALTPKTVLYCHAPVTSGPQLLQDNLRYFDELETHCRAALARGLPADPPVDVDVAGLVEFPFAAAVAMGVHADFLEDYHRTEWHPQQIRMMLAYLSRTR